MFRINHNEVIGSDVNRANETVINSFRNLTHVSNIRIIGKPTFLNSNIKKTFNHLQLAFIEVSILQHFDLESNIQIKTNALGCIIGRVLNQLNLDYDIFQNNLNKTDFGLWYLVAYFFRKIIFV